MFHGESTALCRRHDNDNNNRTEKWQNTKSTPRNFSRNLGQRDGVKWTEKIVRACVFICVFECMCWCVRFSVQTKRREPEIFLDERTTTGHAPPLYQISAVSGRRHYKRVLCAVSSTLTRHLFSRISLIRNCMITLFWHDTNRAYTEVCYSRKNLKSI